MLQMLQLTSWAKALIVAGSGPSHFNLRSSGLVGSRIPPG